MLVVHLVGGIFVLAVLGRVVGRGERGVRAKCGCITAAAAVHDSMACLVRFPCFAARIRDSGELAKLAAMFKEGRNQSFPNFKSKANTN